MGVSVYGAALDGADEAYELELGNPSAFVIGGEGDGLSDPVKAACGRLVRLPIIGRAESLNAAVAGGILLYEAVRQRRAGGL
jgi:23S rRNA (guanosine2251-2'-O)-methyltransferase